MKAQFHQFNPKKFSFQKDPVLVLGKFLDRKGNGNLSGGDDAFDLDGLTGHAGGIPGLPRFRQLAEG